MKISRRSAAITLIAAMLLTVAYVWFVSWSVAAYDQWAAAEVQRISHGDPSLISWIDVTPYSATPYGRVALVGGVLTALVDLVAVVLILKAILSMVKIAALATTFCKRKPYVTFGSFSLRQNLIRISGELLFRGETALRFETLNLTMQMTL